jgi:polyisoprenoid-binding protein YceI
MTTIETLAIAPVGTWRLDPVHSSVGFAVPYLAGRFTGQFRDVEAQLIVRDGEAALEGAATVASVDVKDENLAAHLQSPDFFDAERHPELRFVAHELALEDETVHVNGEITIRGTTKPVQLGGTITAAIADAYGKDRLGLNLSTTVDRTDFGLEWNMPLPSGEPALGNEVRIDAELQFVKEA